MVLKKMDPRVGDDISNHIFVLPPLEAACTVPSILLQVSRAAEDGSVFLTMINGTAVASRIYAVTRAGKFVALIRSERVTNGEMEAKVLPNLSVGRILPGDGAVYVADPKGYLSRLPLDVRMDLASRASQQTIRTKMEMSK